VDHDDEINPWVERIVWYDSLFEKTMDLFRENIGRGVSAMHYNEGAVLWAKEEKADPRIVFQPNNQEAQEVFYRTIDDICATFDTVRKDDWRRCGCFYYSKFLTADHVLALPAYASPARQVVPPSGISSPTIPNSWMGL